MTEPFLIDRARESYYFLGYISQKPSEDTAMLAVGFWKLLSQKQLFSSIMEKNRDSDMLNGVESERETNICLSSLLSVPSAFIKLSERSQKPFIDNYF